MTHPPSKLSPDDLQAQFQLSDTHLSRLKTYAALLAKWQKAINLVGRSTMPDLWRRHMQDSAQLMRLLPSGTGRRLIDLGSGAGFPGLVLAAITDFSVTLIESDQRKATFLREVARAMDVPVTVLDQRIETVEIDPAEVVTARALAPIDLLCGYTKPLLKADGLACFLKGKTAAEELTIAQEHWTMQVSEHDSLTDPQGSIVCIRTLNRGSA